MSNNEDQEATNQNDYMYSRPLDVHVWSDYPEVNDFVDEIYYHLSEITGNKIINKKLLKVVLLDLYVSWRADPDLKVMFSRDNSSYKARSRYNEINIGRKIIKVVDSLVEQEIIHEKRGFHDRVSGTSFQTRLWASDWLKERFREARFSQFCLHSHEGREPLVLRNTEKEDVEYDEAEETQGMRALLSDYNDLLYNTHIDIYDLEVPIIISGSGSQKSVVQVNQNSKFVRRIFNHERWDKGGRFYGGWWQRCPSEYRKRIVMDGILTEEIDYSGLHITILYAKEGISYWGDNNEDPYSISGINSLDPDIDLRAAAKLLLLTALNAENETKTFQAFRSQAPTGSPEKRLTNEQLSSILSALKSKHEPIAHKLASGAGIDLMFVDSQITAKLIERFTYHYKCPILTVHDSYVVPFGYGMFLKKEMEAAFEEVAGSSGTRVEHTTDYFYILQEQPSPEEQETIEPIVRCERHQNELRLFQEFKGKPAYEDWVPDWTSVL
ncbi:hypothetical protein PVV74_04340 [Roseovarius sp. SK2]|uniref:hypothetical protein n=1 Tax=Roseovarius TaxID=74030 RepID=UPI00237C31A1|nr:hypothetical protein [Roseovarius sp. SK2]MDD9724677.1 hypothetical protein [Roseovarius sp. SK2]